MLLTRIRTQLLQPRLAASPTPLHAAERNYQRALNQLTQETESAS